VPVLRYFCVMGLCLLGLIYAAGYFMPQAEGVSAKAESMNVPSGGSLASWRHSQQNLTKPQTAAVVYPDVAPLPPTAERLQWERQLTFRKPDSPALQARAELPIAAVEAAAPLSPIKHMAKVPSRPRTVARAERRNQPNYAAAYPPAPMSQFGGYRQAQYDRPASGFFNFRMF
jgi:hypothetical protein